MLIITRGLPGCGKSTWSKQIVEEDRSIGINTVRVNRDLFRTMLHFDEWSKDNERLTVLARNATLDVLLAKRDPAVNVICDDTNLDPNVVDELRKIAGKRGHAVLIKDFTDVPLDVCIDRDAQRTGNARVGSKVILDMHAKYLANPAEVG